MDPEKVIVCVECGGTAHLLTYLPEGDTFEPGDRVAYACGECNHRLDLVLEEEPDQNEFAGQ